jgi:3-phosphoshikimate 1-carboxyvinyltransferase
MMAAIAATCADAPVIIHGAECVAKSYPRFFDDYAELGGSVILEG